MAAACSDHDNGSTPLDREDYFILLSGSGTLLPRDTTTSDSLSEDTDTYALTLENISDSVTWFSEKPDRSIGQKSTFEFINGTWPDRFSAIAPNAVLDCHIPGEELEDGMYITLQNPAYDSDKDRLTFASVTLQNWTMAEKPETELSFDHVKLTLLPNCINTGQTCWSWAQVSPLVRLIPSDEQGKYQLEMNHIYRELYHVQHAPGYGSEIMSTVSMATNWNDIFEGIPPNASLSAYKDTGELNLLLLTLDNPSYDATDDRFTYDVTLLSGDAPGDQSMHTATLLIDSTGAVDYNKAAAREYRKLLDAWAYDGGDNKVEYEHKMMWYQGNAMDALIDYVAITQDPNKGADLGKKIKTLWETAGPHGAWWDDFGWWGVAFLNAAKNFKILGQQNDTEYMSNAEDCLQKNMHKAKKLWMDQTTTVWEMATTEPACIPCLHTGPANWYRFEPRFSGGVWNSAFAGLNTGPQAACKPSDPNMSLGTTEKNATLPF